MEPISRDDSVVAANSGRAKKATRRKISTAAAVVVVIAIGIAAVVSNVGGNSSRSGSLTSDAIATTCGPSNDPATQNVGSIGRVTWPVDSNTGIVSATFKFTGAQFDSTPALVATLSGVATTVGGKQVFSASTGFLTASVTVDLYTQAGQLVRTTSANC
ncbi:MAG: hypothetical protein WCG37_06650 [Actinomycetes bacterium]